MSEPLVLTDSTLDAVLHGDRPVLVLFTNGEGLRGDFKTAFGKAAAENDRVVFATVNPKENPVAAARFGVADRPLLVGLYCGDELVRRGRPWGTDLPLALEMIESAVRERSPQAPPAPETPIEEQKKAMSEVVNKPVTVSDATFEAEVLNSDLPVLVDFWAAWCGPCRQVAPVLDKLAKEFAGQIKIAKVNVDENPGLSQAFRIMSIPNLMIVKERTVIFNQPGALPENVLRDLIQQAIAIQIPPRDQPEPAAESEEPVQQ